MRRLVAGHLSASWLLAVWLALEQVGAAALQPRADAAADQALRDAIRGRIEQLRTDPQLVVGGDRLLAPDVVAAFFEGRAFGPVWTTRHTVADALEAIRQIERDGLTPAHYHLGAIERRQAEQPKDDTAVADLEILIADAVAAALDHVQFGKVQPAELDPDWNVDPRETAPPLETLLAMVADAPSAGAGIERFVPSHFIYTGLKQALERYRTLASRGGWPSVPEGPALKPGASDRRVVALRKRLAATGELAASADLERTEFDAELEAAVKRFQEANRLTPDVAVGRGTLEALNVTAAARVAQVRANLERARWVLPGLHDTFVLVNLPAFKVYLIREGRNVWDTRAQVGKTARKTPTFRDDIEYLVFNPDWIVPPTILSQDVLGPMRRGDNAVARKGLQIIDGKGRRVDPSTIDWASARSSSFQYTLRQAPGASNALGRVKFVFPNEHAIFLHDTPSRELFAADQRTFSSGCIRVEHALEFARLLLEGDPEWTPERMDDVLASGKTETVFLGESLPILIVYWTVSVGAAGDVRFARDMYGLDPPLSRALDAAPAPGSVR
jgi:murein L,D-transpeptidase YcbB/YkuD